MDSSTTGRFRTLQSNSSTGREKTPNKPKSRGTKYSMTFQKWPIPGWRTRKSSRHLICEGALSKLKQCLIWLCFPEKYNLQGPPCTKLRANSWIWQRFWISMPFFLQEGLKRRTKAQFALPPPAGAAPLTQNGPLAVRLLNYFTQLLGWEAFFRHLSPNTWTNKSPFPATTWNFTCRYMLLSDHPHKEIRQSCINELIRGLFSLYTAWQFLSKLLNNF